jgi:hypothetical protein
MSLPLRKQPLQSQHDYNQSLAEQKLFADVAFANTSRGIRWFWDRFGGDQVSNRITRARKDEPPQLSQFFNYNQTNIIDGGFSLPKKPACCKSCSKAGDSPAWPVTPYSKPPFTCQMANPQAEGANCPPWHGLPTQEYLYNDFYLCCATDPFGATAGELLSRAKFERNSIDHGRLNLNLDPATRTQGGKAQKKVGHLMRTSNHFVSTRVSTS